MAVVPGIDLVGHRIGARGGAAGLDSDGVRRRFVHGADEHRRPGVQGRGHVFPARLVGAGEQGEAVAEQVQGGDCPVAVLEPVVGYASAQVPGQGLRGRALAPLGWRSG
jgi:hypothetical protein